MKKAARGGHLRNSKRKGRESESGADGRKKTSHVVSPDEELLFVSEVKTDSMFYLKRKSPRRGGNGKKDGKAIVEQAR